MLYRKNQNKILEFIENDVYKSMLLVGVRQCGKTTLLKNILSDYNVLYCNLEERSDVSSLFDSNISADKLVENIELLLNQYLNHEQRMILIIDEIQTNPRAITSLKYFDESEMNIKVIGSGSLLGVQLKQNSLSFPVGKVDILNMYPLDFEEFLINNNMEKHIEKIKQCFATNTQMPNAIHDLLTDTFKMYLKVGGMPQAVASYLNNNLEQIENIHSNLNEGYLNDITKYVEGKDKAYMRLILENLGNELLKENQKYKLSNIKPGLKYRQVENSFAWLAASDITYRASIIDNKQVCLPLKANVKANKFKLFYCDTALLINKMNYQLEHVKAQDHIYIGMIIENYVATEIYKKHNKQLYTYDDNSKEIDFILEVNNQLVPIEVKAAKNTKSKSLVNFMDKNKVEMAYRISEKNFGLTNNIKSIPHYATFLI